MRGTRNIAAFQAIGLGSLFAISNLARSSGSIAAPSNATQLFIVESCMVAAFALFGFASLKRPIGLGLSRTASICSGIVLLASFCVIRCTTPIMLDEPFLAYASLALFSFGLSVLYFFWQRILSFAPHKQASIVLVVSCLVASIESEVGSELIPPAAQVTFAFILIACAVAPLVASSRQSRIFPNDRTPYSNAAKKNRDELISIFATGLIAGFLENSLLGTTIDYHDASLGVTFGMLCAAIVLGYALLLSKRPVTVSHMYKTLIPFLIIGFWTMSFSGSSYTKPTIFFYSLLVWSIMPATRKRCLDIGCEANLNPLPVFAIFGGCMHAGLSLGTALELVFQNTTGSDSSLTMQVMLLLYIISISLLALLHRKESSLPSRRAEHTRLDGERSLEAPENMLPVSPTERTYDSFEKSFGLSQREMEIVMLVASGRDTPHIAKKLYISENTVKTHLRRIYAKTNVRSKQDLLDLLEKQESRPSS